MTIDHDPAPELEPRFQPNTDLLPEARAENTSLEGLTEADIAEVERVSEEMAGLLTDQLRGYSVMRQLDARSDEGERVRDALIGKISSTVGADIDAHLTASELDDIELTLSQRDVEALGIDADDEGVSVSALVRRLDLATPRGDKFRLTEIEFPNRLLLDDGTVVDRYNRILNLTPAPVAE